MAISRSTTAAWGVRRQRKQQHCAASGPARQQASRPAGGGAHMEGLAAAQVVIRVALQPAADTHWPAVP